MNKQNKTNLIIIWIFSLFLCMLEFILGNNKNVSVMAAIVIFSSCCIATLVYKTKLSELQKGILISTVPALGTILLSILVGGNVLSIFCGFLTLFVTTLYFNQVILLVHSCAFFVCALLASFKNPHYIAGIDGSATLAILILMTYALLAYLLWQTTRKGNHLVQESNDNSELAMEQHEQIKARSKHAETITTALNVEVTELTAQMHSIAEISTSVTDTRKEISRNTDSFANALREVYAKIHLTRQQNEDTYTLADALKTNYKEVLDNSRTGKEQGELLTASIMEMSTSVNDTLRSTNDLLAETNTIHSIIGELKSISSQTNLLALNASIEAARVGLNEEGFGIVAEQIRELSEQSKEASDTMNALLGDLSRLIATVAEKLKDSVSVIDYSITSTNELMGNMEQIDAATYASSTKIEQELASMDNIRKHFELMTTKLNSAVALAKNNNSIVATVSDSLINEMNTIDSVNTNINTIDEATISISQFFTNN